MAEHTDAEGTFTSPDEANEKNLPHWRLRMLEAVDVVDEPAANPGGLFSTGRTSSFVAEAEAVASFALGITDEQPERSLFDRIHPERVRRFMQGYLERHDLAVVSRASDGPGPHSIPPMGRETQMELKDLTIEQLAEARPDLVNSLEQQGAEAAAAKQGTPPDMSEQLAAARAEGEKEARSLLASFREVFSEDEKFAVEQFAKGASLDEANDAFREQENATLKARIAELESKVGASPVAHQEPSAGASSPDERLAKAREYATEHKCSIRDALRATAN